MKALRLKARSLADNYPVLLAEARRVSAMLSTGVHGRRKAGQGETFWQYRPYTPTDAAHRIDWRRSARGDELFIRDNEWESANSIYLWQDMSPGMDWHSEKSLPLKSERAAIILLALSHLLMQGGEHCSILGSETRTRTGRQGLDRLFEDWMNSEGHLNELKCDIKAHSKIIIASDFLGPLESWKENLSRLATRPAEGVLVHIIDPAEQSFPYKGRLKLKMPGVETVKSFLVGRAEIAKENYTLRFEKHLRDVKDLGKAVGWKVVQHRTNEPASLALNALYGILSGQFAGGQQ